MVTLPLWFGAIVFCSVNKITIGYSLVVLWLGLCVFTAEGTGSNLVGELRFHRPYGTAKKEKKN